MGFWGYSLYANDTTCDVRDTYFELLEQLNDDDLAFKKTLVSFQELLQDADEIPLFWYALAESMWQVGRLTEEVKERALEYIYIDGGINHFKNNPRKANAWRTTLNKLKLKILSPQPKRRDYARRRVLVSNPWEVGDVIAYRLHDFKETIEENKDIYIIFRKVGNKQIGTLASVIEFYNGLFTELPKKEDMIDLKILPFIPFEQLKREMNTDLGNYKRLCEQLESGLFSLYKRTDYFPKNDLFYLGNIPTNGYDYENQPWSNFYDFWFSKREEYLRECLMSWNQKECWPDGTSLSSPKIECP